MKKCLAYLLINLLSMNSSAQWQTTVQLTFSNISQNAYITYNNAHAIAVNGKYIHVIWTDGRDGNREIYYKQSNDGGLTWLQDIRLTNNPNWSEYPCIAVHDSVIHVVWMDDRDLSYSPDIYYKRSTDNGVTWGEDEKLTFTHTAGIPSMAVIQNDIHIVWYDIRNGNWEVYYTRSNDAGMSWSTERRLTIDQGTSWMPSVCATGSMLDEKVYIVWSDDRDGDKEIYFKLSNDGGNTWSDDIRLTNSAGESESPCINFNGTQLNICWSDTRNGNADIYFKYSSDGSQNWSDDIRITDAPSISGSPTIAANSQVIHIAWQDFKTGNQEIYYTRSTNNGIVWETNFQLTNNSTESILPSLAINDSSVNFVWEEGLNSTYSIFYRSNQTGNIITSIYDDININPGDFLLFQNYPNPFNPSTKIRWQSPASGWQSLKVYDVLGNEVGTLVDEYKPAGSFEVEFNPVLSIKNLGSGIYFYRLQVGDFIQTKKMIFIK